MIYYIASRYNSDLGTEGLMDSASRCLFLAIHPDTGSGYPYYDVFDIYGSGSDHMMMVNSEERIEVNEKSHISDFLDMFSISLTEKKNILDPITQGNIVLFDNITPSNVVTSSYQDLVDAGIIEPDDVD
jgi:hypothetical protein